MTTDKETFKKRTQENVKEAVDPIVLEMLAEMVSQEACAHDIFYIESRIKEIIEKKLEKLTWFDLNIRKLRKDLYEKAAAKAKKKKVPLEEDSGETQIRNERCEKICQSVAEKLLGKNIINSDNDFLNEAVEDDDRMLLTVRLFSMIDGLIESASYSINQGLLKANKKFWGKEKDEITMKQIDNYLKG